MDPTPLATQVKSVCCVGAGYVGGPSMAVFAKNCPDLHIVVADTNRRRIDAWNSNILPIYEPGLDDVVQKVRGKNLHFTWNVSKAISDSQLVFVCVNTPSKTRGTFGIGGYDLTAVESVARSIAAAAEHSTIIVEKSTVPVRTAERMRQILNANKRRPDIHFEVISNPEFLAEGSAIRDFENPDRVLIGGRDTPEGKQAVEALANIYKKWVPEANIVTTGLWSSELAKLAANAMLAQRISSMNSLSVLCERVGADIDEISMVVGRDKRIGAQFLKASVGFGGSCFGKDLAGLVYLCEAYNLHEVAEYWRQVLVINDFQKRRFSATVVDKLNGTVLDKNICVFGFAFKKNTGDSRESAAIDICRHLLEEGANVFVYDPKVPHADISRLSEKITPLSDPYAAALDSHAIIILTEWDEFKYLDYNRIFSHMSKPAYVFDGRNILDHNRLEQIGFQVVAIGKSFNGLEYRHGAN